MSDAKKTDLKITQDDLKILGRHADLQRLLRRKKEIRSLLDDHPIDLSALETALREALGALPGAMELGFAREGMKDYELYCKDLLALIVGKQH
jgi:hypothetical protein